MYKNCFASNRQVLAGALVAVFGFVAGAQPGWAVRGYKLQQTSDFYGDSTLLVTPKSMKLLATKMGITVYTRFPETNLVAWNDQNHQYINLSQKQLTGEFLGGFAKEAPRYRYVKLGSTKIAGCPADVYLVDSLANKHPKKPTFTRVNGVTYNAKYCVTKAIKVPTDLFMLYSHSIGVPGELGFPLRMEQYDVDERPVMTFDTKKIERAEVDEKIRIPKGYVKAQDELSLLMGSTKTGKMAALGADLDALFGDKEEEKQRLGWVPGMKTPTEIGPDGLVKMPAKPPVKPRSSGWYPGCPY